MSIQAHPDKKLAEKLHKSNPENYKDSNHKPELALALTEMEALCQFRPCSEIKAFLLITPELREAVGEDIAQKFESDKTNAKASLQGN